MKVIAFDTSNYTTSCAIFDGEQGVNSSRLLDVKPGELGLRQSEALFSHVKRLPEIVSKLDLSETDLVVLSACQSGSGELNGDGIWGLQRGFKKAGVQSLLITLWNVNDHATQLFMENFCIKPPFVSKIQIS